MGRQPCTHKERHKVAKVDDARGDELVDGEEHGVRKKNEEIKSNKIKENTSLEKGGSGGGSLGF